MLVIDRTKGFYDERRETMSAAERAAYARALLREAVEHAYANAPAARRRFDEAGILPRDIREVGDLAKIPPVRKADLKSIQRRELPFGGLAAAPPRAMRRIYVSPGPTYDPEGRDESHWRWEKAFIAAGFRPGDIVQNTFMYHFSPAGLMFDEALIRIGCTVVPAGVGNTELQVQVMRDLGVTGYVGTPSFLMTLLEKTREAGFGPDNGLRLQVALVAAEMLPESLRKRFREEFGIEVRQCYGTADVGSIGYECYHASGMHVSDEIILELLDPVTAKPVADGEIGEVVVTLSNRTYPLIRFATGDLSILDRGGCPCGRTSPRLVRIVGRVDQVTKIKGMFIHPEQIAAIEEKFPEVATLQVIVTRESHEDRMLVQAVPAPGMAPTDELAARLAETVREVTRLKGQVCFVAKEELTDKEKKIVDRRKWE